MVDLEWLICGGLIPRVHPRVLLCVCPCGIVLVRPHVTSFINAWTTFKASGDILLGLFVPLSSPHLPDSLKSSLICETMANWHPDDWWDSPHPHIYISRLASPVSYLQQDGKDDKLYHDASSDTTPNRPGLPCHYCAIITTRANSALLSLPPPLNTIKTLLK